MLFAGRDKNLDETNSSPESPRIYQGNRFTIDQPEGWQDKTIYTLAGPMEDGIQHNILINVEQDVEIGSVAEFADRQIEVLEAGLQGCRLLKRGELRLANDLEAYEAIFRWCPADEVRLYQRQIYVLYENTAYTLTTSFTKKTRKTRGPEVDRIMMSFRPSEIGS